MNPRKILTTALLGFILTGFGFLAVRSVRAARNWRAPAAAQDSTAEAADRGLAARRTGKAIAYYFHVMVRCTTCRNIEMHSKEAIHDRFGKELAAGQLEWRLVNVQLPENRHFIEDFRLSTSRWFWSVRPAAGMWSTKR
jgi:hypothetical protein